MQEEFKDKRGREWEVFIDDSYYGMFCVRVKDDRDFNSPVSFHFMVKEKALQFVELLKESR